MDKTDRKIIGATLIGLGILSDSKETRFLSGLFALAILFPDETVKVLNTMKTLIEKESKKPSCLKPSPKT